LKRFDLAELSKISLQRGLTAVKGYLETYMESYKSLTHSRYDCRYHVVFVPKCRKKALFGKIREYLKEVFHELARQKGCEIISGHIATDHVHMCIMILPKHAVS
jgi:putative transposase